MHKQCSLFLVVVLSTFANPVWGRTAVAFEDPPLAELLEEIGLRFGVFFTYDASQIAEMEVEFKLDPEESLEETVERLLEKTALAYESYGEKYFVLFEDTKRGRRQSGKLRRKVRQLDRLEHHKQQASLIRGDTPLDQFVLQIQREQKRIEQRTLRGIVLGEGEEPLIGVSIRVDGTNQGVVSAYDGSFTLVLPGEESLLTFSYLGYQMTQVAVTAGETVNVRLQQTRTDLPEVLIMGYGVVSAAEVTASISQINTNEVSYFGALQAPHQWLNGNVAGVQVLGGNEERGTFRSVRIRGGSSMNASNEPLYVIDGMPVDNSPNTPAGVNSGQSPLNALNPEDIAKITVLKDASGAAIYGSRAANGVILIETKKGQLYQSGSFSYNGWCSVAETANQVEVFDADGFRELVRQVAPSRANELGDANTDWQSTILRSALSQQHTLSYTAGSKVASYRASIGYLGRQSILTGVGHRRLTASINARRDFFGNQLTLTADAKLASIQDRYVNKRVVFNAYVFNPTLPVYDNNSPWGGYFEYANDETIKNPLSEINQVKDESRDQRLLSHLKLSYSPKSIQGLKATVYLGGDYTLGMRNSFAPASSRLQYANQGEFRSSRYHRANRLWESYLNYNHRYASDRLGMHLTAGYSYQHAVADFPKSFFQGIEGNDFTFGNLPAQPPVSTLVQYTENRLASFFGRGSFDLHHRYFLTASLRSDGSSRFSPGNRWATFPAVSAAWRISEEPFFANHLKLVSDLKLRLGWGLTGNQEIGDFLYLPTYTLGGATVQYPFGEDYLITARPNAISSQLKWEQTSSFNLALEAGFINDRIQTIIEVYEAKTKDLLSRILVPAGSNLSDVVLTNVGSILNRGVEFTLNAKVIAGRKFNWSLGFNIATNHNQILSLGSTPNNNFQAISTGTISGAAGNTIQIYQAGHPLQSFYVFSHLRDANGNPLRDGVDHNLDGQTDLADIYSDLNDDGTVNDLDKRAFGQPAPKVFGGIQSRWHYGKFGLQTSLRFQAGNYVYNNPAADGENLKRILVEREILNMPVTVLDNGFRQPQYFSDYYVEDASFFRMDAITVDYSRKATTKKPGLRIYLSLQNVFTLTGYRGLDPEVGNVSGNPNIPRYGIDDTVYPRSRTWLAGLGLNL
jgi:TonB-linked SusC/RagA family outer membrane protein